MREILFRGKRVKKYCKAQSWTEGVPFIDHEGDCIMATDYSKLVVDEKTVGQYIGLTDKNGTKIFEGDIITFTSGLNKKVRTATIEFEDGAFVYRNLEDRFSLSFIDSEYILYATEVEIIGNIHDNPELLKVGD